MRNFTFIVILAFGTQYIWAAQPSNPLQPYQTSVKPVATASKSMPPDPLEKKKMVDIRSQLISLGFNVGTVKKIKANQWRVTVAGWNSKKTTQSTKGIINFNEAAAPGGVKCQLDSPCGSGKKPQGSKNWDPTDKSRKVGHGTMMIEVDEDGLITFSQRSLNMMGLRADRHKMQGKFGIK